MQFIHAASPGRFAADDYLIEPLDELIAVLHLSRGDTAECLREYEAGFEKYSAIMELLRKEMSPESVLTVAGAMADIVLFKRVLEENPAINPSKAKEEIEHCLSSLGEGKELYRGFYRRMLDLIKVKAGVVVGGADGREKVVAGAGARAVPGLARLSMLAPKGDEVRVAEEAALKLGGC